MTGGTERRNVQRPRIKGKSPKLSSGRKSTSVAHKNAQRVGFSEEWLQNKIWANIGSPYSDAIKGWRSTVLQANRSKARESVIPSVIGKALGIYRKWSFVFANANAEALSEDDGVFLAYNVSTVDKNHQQQQPVRLPSNTKLLPARFWPELA